MQRGGRQNPSQPPTAESPSETGPQRTCVGCRSRHDQSALLRFRRRRDGHVVPAIGRREAAGRGAWLCPRPSCFTTAERQRSFARAFTTKTHGHDGAKPAALEVHFDPRRAWTDSEARLRSEIDLLDRSAATVHDHPRRRALARLASELTSQPAPPERSPTSSRKGKGGSPSHG
ncbi:YlxR family protein [Nannocystaceae bacterium ST9]